MRGGTRRLNVDEFERWWAQTGEYELRQILHWKWDPIGISCNFPYAADEYDSYAPQVVAALNSGVSRDQLAELLGSIEKEWMGLSGSPLEHLRGLSADIFDWFESSKDRWIEFGPLRR